MEVQPLYVFLASNAWLVFQIECSALTLTWTATKREQAEGTGELSLDYEGGRLDWWEFLET